VPKIKDNITPGVENIIKVLQQTLPQVAADTFKANTPIRTGNARRKTRKQGMNVRAGYPYATELEKGRSRQAPEGMAKPTSQTLNKYLKRELRKL
jgi:hypothetical protein